MNPSASRNHQLCYSRRRLCGVLVQLRVSRYWVTNDYHEGSKQSSIVADVVRAYIHPIKEADKLLPDVYDDV